MNYINDNVGFYSCDCASESDHSLINGDCVEESLCPEVDGHEMPRGTSHKFTKHDTQPSFVPVVAPNLRIFSSLAAFR